MWCNLQYSFLVIDAVWLLFYYLVGTSKLKTVHLQGFYQNSVSQVFGNPIKNRASSRLLAQISVSQVFWEPIKNRVSPRSVLLKAVYLKALLYILIDQFSSRPGLNCSSTSDGRDLFEPNRRNLLTNFMINVLFSKLLTSEMLSKFHWTIFWLEFWLEFWFSSVWRAELEQDVEESKIKGKKRGK